MIMDIKSAKDLFMHVLQQKMRISIFFINMINYWIDNGSYNDI